MDACCIEMLITAYCRYVCALKLVCYYHFKLLNLVRQHQTYSKKNFCKPRGPQQTYYYIVVIIVAGKNMQESEMKYTFN